MQSNRALIVVLLLVLAVGAVVAWQFLGGEPATLPHPDNTDTASQQDPAGGAAAGEADGASGALARGNATAVREAVAAADPRESDMPAIVGQIVDANARPIAGAEVQCVPGGGFVPDFDTMDPGDMPDFGPEAMVERMRQQASERVIVASDADGRFRLRVEGTSRTVSLRVLARSHLALDRTVPRPVDRDTDLGQLELETGAVIAGRVLDPQGNVIAGARVSRMLEIETRMSGGLDIVLPGMEAMEEIRGGETCVTDEAGRFELAHVPAGDFTLRARHADHPTAQRKGLSVAVGQSLTDVLVTMARGAEIRGTVVDLPEVTRALRVMAAARPTIDPNAATNPAAGILGMMGDPTELLADMGMAAGERTVEIQRDGSFVLRGLDASKTYRLWLAQQGSGFAGSGICSQRVEAAAGSSGIELRYAAGITVTFVVVDAQSGQPIERLWVRDQLRGGGGFGDMMAFAPGNTKEQPYPEGRVTVANLRPKKGQTLRLTIDAIGHAQLERDDIELPSSGSLDLGKLSLERKAAVQVTVVSAYDDQPIAKARVQLSDKSERGGFGGWGGRSAGPQSGQTDDTGRCTLNVPDAQLAELQVQKSGFAPAQIEVAIDSGGAADQTVRLMVGGTAEVTVLGPDKEPVANAQIEHRTPDGDTDRRRTDAAGVCSFTNLAPGSHEFRLAVDRGAMGFAIRMGRNNGNEQEAEAAWQSVDIIDRGTAELTLEKNPTAVLRGIVRENGMPLAGATVAFREGVGSDGPEAAFAGVLGNMLNQGGQGARRQDKTGADGTYELTDLPSGEHRLHVTHRDRAMPTVLPLPLREGDNRLDIDLDMTSLQGVVRGPDGNPVEGARVTVKVLAEGAQGRDVGRMVAYMMPGMGLGGPEQESDGNGAFELRGVEPGVRLQVEATAKGLAPTSVEATVARGQVGRGIELRLGAAGRIEVTVEGAGMFAAVTARLTGEGSEGGTPAMQMLRRGKCTLDGLLPGTYEVEYRGMQNRDEPAQKRTVTVAAGETVKVDF